nr:hypothetical protein [uncultured Draconibacterium sp.]
MAVAETISKKKRHLNRRAAELGEKCFESFYFFFKTFWPEMSGEEYHDNWHIKLICDVLQEKAMKLIKLEQIMETIVINVPPGSSKSTIVTVAFPLWVWLHRPNFTTTNISYSATLSKKHAYLARGITDSKKFHLFFDRIFQAKHGKKLEILKQNELEILNNFKGSRFNTSVGGTITGMHANIIIEDDPMNPEEAHSEAERENAIRFHDETISTRLKNFVSYLNIIIAQRLHEGDTCGHVLNQNIPITHICLPGILSNNVKVFPESARKFYIDGLLDPIRKPKIAIDQLKVKLNKGFSGQVLQMPFNLDDQDIKPEMFQIIDSVRDDIIWDVWIDGAFTEKNENDPSGIDLIAKVGNDIIWKHSYDVYKKLPDLFKFIVELEQTGQFDKEKSRIFIEPKASGHPLADLIEYETEYNFVRIGEHNKQEAKLVQGGKKARHEVIKPKAESHRIKVLKGSWNDEAIIQVCGFPKAAHDEHVDNLGYAINHYYMNENSLIEEWALNALAKLVAGSVNMFITSSMKGKRIETSYDENDSGDVQLFDYPNKLYQYRYLCVLVLRGEGERGGTTSILVYDRQVREVSAAFFSTKITPRKAGKKAVEIASLYDKARLVVAVQKTEGQAHNEEYDLSHIALAEIKKLQYENIYSRLTVKDIKQKREREFGFEVNHSTSREVYYNLKDQAESAKIGALPIEVFEEIKLLERKKETGEVDAREGYKTNAALAYALAIKVDDEWEDKPTVKKSGKW